MERKEIFNRLNEIFIDVLDLDEVELTDEQDIKMFNRTLDLLDDDDDVQEVYHNGILPEEE